MRAQRRRRLAYPALLAVLGLMAFAPLAVADDTVVTDVPAADDTTLVVDDSTATTLEETPPPVTDPAPAPVVEVVPDPVPVVEPAPVVEVVPDPVPVLEPIPVPETATPRAVPAPEPAPAIDAIAPRPTEVPTVVAVPRTIVPEETEADTQVLTSLPSVPLERMTDASASSPLAPTGAQLPAVLDHNPLSVSLLAPLSLTVDRAPRASDGEGASARDAEAAPAPEWRVPFSFAAPFRGGGTVDDASRIADLLAYVIGLAPMAPSDGRTSTAPPPTLAVLVMGAAVAAFAFFMFPLRDRRRTGPRGYATLSLRPG